MPFADKSSCRWCSGTEDSQIKEEEQIQEEVREESQVQEEQTEISQKIIELSDYLGDETVRNIAKQIGGMEVTSNEDYKEYATVTNLIIGILADKQSEHNSEQIDVYNQITDIINSGNKDVSLFGICIGDTLEEVKQKHGEMYRNMFEELGNGVYGFWFGDAAVLYATFEDDKLVSYIYEVRYTS